MRQAMIVMSEFGKDKGGIQNWMYFVQKLLSFKGWKTEAYAYKEDHLLEKLGLLLTSKVYFLATWKMSFFIFPVLLSSKRTFFIFVHGNDILRLNMFQKKWIRYLCGKSKVHFIANSKAVATLFYKEIEHNVDLVQPPFVEIINHNLKIKHEMKRAFLTVSRLVKRKNIQSIIRALHRLKKEGLDFHYYIAGDGEEKRDIISLVKNLSMENEVEILGRVSEDQKKSLYKRSNYFLLPSIYDAADGSIEGYGIVFIEANSYGLPVLSGNTGGMTEAVIDEVSGLHCDGSVDDIFEKITKMLNIKFDAEALYQYAKKHDFRVQQSFMNFIEKKIDE